MKKIAAWTLLAVYLNASAQLLLPLVSDCFAHLFFWHDHLEHVHHGHVHSSHAALEIAALAGDDDHQHPGLPHAAFLPDKDALSAHVLPVSVPLLRPPFLLRPPGFGARHFYYTSVAGEVLLPPPDRV